MAKQINKQVNKNLNNREIIVKYNKLIRAYVSFTV
jgi:hypothetical protein